MVSEHHAVLTRATPRDVAAFTVECSDPTSCEGWIECLQAHEHPDRADAGPWVCHNDEPCCENDEFTFHGLTHEWNQGHGWCVPLPAEQCPVTTFADSFDKLEHLPPGRYLVDANRDDTNLHLTAASAEQHRVA